MLRKNLCTLGVSLVALLATACAPGTYNGGGWIPSADGDPMHKATIAFVIHAEDTTGNGEVDSAKGQFQYNDHGLGVRAHASVANGGQMPAFILLFDENFQYVGSGQLGSLEGTYEVLPAGSGAGGTVQLGILPLDEGPQAGETYVRVEYLDGEYAGYVNFGRIKGNIQFHPGS